MKIEVELTFGKCLGQNIAECSNKMFNSAAREKGGEIMTREARIN